MKKQCLPMDGKRPPKLDKSLSFFYPPWISNPRGERPFKDRLSDYLLVE
jgi:hypothetical protein